MEAEDHSALGSLEKGVLTTDVPLTDELSAFIQHYSLDHETKPPSSKKGKGRGKGKGTIAVTFHAPPNERPSSVSPIYFGRIT